MPNPNPVSTIRRPAIRRLLAATVVVMLTAGTAAVTSATVGAAPPTSVPLARAQAGAHWLAGQVNPAGFVPGPTNAPNVGTTLQVAIGLADVGTEKAAFDRIVAWAEANPELAITSGGSDDSAGNLGALLMIASAAGIAPTSFGGQDLPARLAATLGDFAPGLYGAADPSYDGAFRQSLAILGLEANGVVPPAAATGWLIDQQCDASTPAATGGWEAYRMDTTVPCGTPGPSCFTCADTNSTAMAIQALIPVASFSGAGAGLDFLATVQGSSGGFPLGVGGEEDPNSTALVIQAIIAGGEDPSTGRWSQNGATPYPSLVSWQLGCTAPAADRGAFTSPYSSGAADQFSTVQALWGLTGTAFPLAGPVTFTPTIDPCAPPPPVTPPTSTVPSPAPTAPAARPVPAVPALAG